MEEYMKELNKVGEIVTKVQAILQKDLGQEQLLGFEYGRDYIAFKIYKEDKCSYSRMQVKYSEELEYIDAETYAGALLLKYYNRKFTTYIATEEEIFISGLIQKYECENFYVDGGELIYEGMSFPLEDITKITYYKTIDSIRVDTNTEYGIIEFDRDKVTFIDKDEVAL